MKPARTGVGAALAFLLVSLCSALALPEPALPEPALPEPALPEPALPDSALPDSALPDSALPEPALPAAPLDIGVAIHDRRASVVESLSVPGRTEPGKGREAEIEVSPLFRDRVVENLRSALDGSQGHVQVDVEILQGKVGWRARRHSDREYANARLRVVVTVPSADPSTTEATADAALDRNPERATTRRLRTLFLDTLTLAFENFLTADSNIAWIAARLEQSSATL